MSLGELRPQSGLVWGSHLNGDSTDFSGGNRNGTDTSITYSQANGKFGQGAGFAAASNSKIVTTVNPNGYLKAITINAWIKGTAVSMEDYAGVIEARSGDNSNLTGLGVGASGYGDKTKIEFSVNSQSSGTPTFVITGGWHMVTGIYDGTNIKLYIDGVLYSQSSYTSNIATNGNFLIGSDPYDTNNRTFAGAMDEVSIWNVAKSAAWVRQQYQLGRMGE